MFVKYIITLKILNQSLLIMDLFFSIFQHNFVFAVVCTTKWVTFLLYFYKLFWDFFFFAVNTTNVFIKQLSTNFKHTNIYYMKERENCLRKLQLKEVKVFYRVSKKNKRKNKGWRRQKKCFFFVFFRQKELINCVCIFKVEKV